MTSNLTYNLTYNDFLKFNTLNNDEIFMQQINIAINAINKLQLWQWIKEKQSMNGFIGDKDDNMINYTNEFFKNGGDGNCTFMAIILRHLQWFASNTILDNNPRICAICTDEDNFNKSLLDCGHIFHHSCLVEYSNSNSNLKDKSCPLCRKNTIPPYLIKY